jgi:hypothetical protein
MEQTHTAEQHGVVPSQRVRVLDECARVFVPGQTARPEPQVHLVRDGNTVKAIEVVCPCGQRIRLKCVYS